MIVVKQLSAELQVQLVPEMADSLLNVLRLNPQILFIIKSDFHFRFRFLSLVCPVIPDPLLF